MGKVPKERIEVGTSIVQIARIKPPAEPDDPAVAFMPTPVSLAQLTSASPANSGTMKTRHPADGEPEQQPPLPVARSRPKPSTPAAPVARNKSKSPDYARVNLQLHNDVVTRLFIIGRSRGKRYTTLIEEYILAGLERDKG
ncbi:hypothetical protein [Mesorhizobium denitrificans]|uniref:Uncharacterized protein n=1 Tax=Mesorhizobium denitrificans TaxID=2294114 RepID=A0A371X6C4_9HYPH|nr:hypothetical protein [Mesorhizobium denitrificans]RFC64777.1 hypothetical protein DY251_18610 [Mesorhizobium denitrificans]